jgi:hypothetical protein
MATTTTNFGWDIPQSTDLVKDGATAIAALGQDIDTALVDLKGGTTGQVLAKASGTDLDFSWVAQDDSNAIQNAIVDAKGDLIGATAADTPARLAVGTNGQVLTADSTAATGLKWATPSGGGTYSAYTPSWTGLTVGNGTVIARYTNVGKFVHGYVRLTFGSTTSVGSNPKFSLPSTPQTGGLMNYGYGMYEDTGTANYAAYVTNDSNLLILRYTTSATGAIGSISSSQPFTWTTGDGVAIQFVYEEA